MCYHHSFTVTPESISKKSGEFGVSVVDIVGVAGAKSIDAVG